MTRLFHAKHIMPGLLFSLITLFAVSIGYLYSTTQASSHQGAGTYETGVDRAIDETTAVLAIRYAAERGLITSGNIEADRTMIEKSILTTRKVWNSILRMEISPDALALGYNLDQSVLVVIIRGQVDWSRGPSLPNPNEISPAILDNLYIVMDAETGQRIGSAAFNPGQQLPFYPAGTIAGGTAAVYREAVGSPEDLLPAPPE